VTSPGGSSPLRTGGFALLAVAVVAALIGLLSLANRGASNDQALAPTAGTESALPAPGPSSTVAPAPPGDANLAAPGAPGATPAPPGAPAPGAPAPGAPAPAPPSSSADEPIAPYTPPGSSESGQGSSAGTARAPLRVYNNSMITGLADRAAADFRDAGWDVTSVGNYSQGTIPTSTVYYESDDEAAAQALAEDFGMRAMPRFAGLGDASPGLIVIVTKEYSGR